MYPLQNWARARKKMSRRSCRKLKWNLWGRKLERREIFVSLGAECMPIVFPFLILFNCICSRFFLLLRSVLQFIALHVLRSGLINAHSEFYEKLEVRLRYTVTPPVPHVVTLISLANYYRAGYRLVLANRTNSNNWGMILRDGMTTWV